MKTSNGICAKDKNGKRKHSYVETLEVYGNKIVSCEKCGNFPLNYRPENSAKKTLKFSPVLL
jgi:hypothetical protein